MGLEILLAKIWTIAVALTLSVASQLAAQEDFGAVRRFLDTTSPLAARTAPADRPASSGSPSEPAGRPVFVQPDTNERLVQNLLGRMVTDPQGEAIGTVYDLLVDPNGRIVGVVVSHGGVLGFGERIVGVNWSHVTHIGRAIELKAMPTALADAPPFVPPTRALPRE